MAVVLVAEKQAGAPVQQLDNRFAVIARQLFIFLGGPDPDRYVAPVRARHARCLRLARQIVLLYLRQLVTTHRAVAATMRPDEHTPDIQSLMRIAYAVFCGTNTNKVGPSNPPE